MASPELNAVTVAMAVVGAVCIYGAVTNRNPIDVVRLTIQGEDISTARPLSTGGGAAPGPGARDGATLPGTPEADGDARTDPQGFDPQRDDILPNYGSPYVPGGGIA